MKTTVFTSGRTELAGNHTDHQNGRILASAVDLGLYASCEKNGTNLIRVKSDGFEYFEAKLDYLNISTVDFGSPKALVRGVVSECNALGLSVGGFDAEIKSTLPVGSGMSSSAAFAVLMGKILSILFNDRKVDPIVIARAAQAAENKFFGKPCGLMDQIVCALGHTVYVDFKTWEIEPIQADFSSMGLALCLTHTGGRHAGLDNSYARIPQDMVYIANLLNKGLLGDVDPELFRSKNNVIRRRDLTESADNQLSC